MAKKNVIAKKAAKKEKPELKTQKALKGGKNKKEKEEIEPLETFQEVEKTGRGKKKDKKEKKDHTEGVIAPPVAHEDISKVKLDKTGCLVITYTAILSDGSTKDKNETYKKRVIHPDLAEMFDKLRVHLGLQADYISTQKIKPLSSYSEKRIQEFVVRGFTIGDGKKGKFYVISGFKRRADNKTITLNTPMEYLEAEETTRYNYMDELEKLINSMLEEVKQYVEGTKVGTAQQQSFAFPATDEDDDDDTPDPVFTDTEDKSVVQ